MFVSDRQRRAYFAQLNCVRSSGSNCVNRFSSRSVGSDFKEVMFESIPSIVDEVISKGELDAFESRGVVLDSLSKKVSDKLISDYNIPREIVLRDVDGVVDDSNLKRQIYHILDTEDSLGFVDLESYESPIEREKVFEAVKKVMDKSERDKSVSDILRESSLFRDKHGEELEYIVGEARDLYTGEVS